MTAIEAAPPQPAPTGRIVETLAALPRTARPAATFVCHVTFWLAVWAFGPTLFGWQAVALRSGSMSPVLNFGDVVVAQPYDGGELAPGTVVVFHAPGSGQLMTHRVIGVLPDGSYRTRGDANQAADSTPLKASEIVAVGRLRVPFIGLGVALWAGGALLPLAALITLLMVAAFLREGGSVRPGAGPRRQPASRWRRLARIAVATLVAAVAAGHLSNAAFAESTMNGGNALAASRIFPSRALTSGFVVRDASGGGEVDRSSPYVAAGDGRTATTKPWAAGFSTSRYLQFDMSAPLPAGQALSAPVFRLTFASAGVSTACVHIEVRRISTDAVLATYGNSGSPAACVTGTTLTTLALAVPVVTATDLADDLRVRVLGRESEAVGMVVDEARFTAATPYLSFSTYPIRVADAADGVPLVTPWDLQGP